MRMYVLPADGPPVLESEADTKRFFADTTYVHFVGMLVPPRPGVADCFQTLEHTHYVPDTPQNSLFHFRLLEWQDIVWGIASIPALDKHLMESSAQANGLRVDDGVITMITNDGVIGFPISNDRVFSLVNVRNHPVYHKNKS
jgi:hypothetical protein